MTHDICWKYFQKVGVSIGKVQVIIVVLMYINEKNKLSILKIVFNGTISNTCPTTNSARAFLMMAHSPKFSILTFFWRIYLRHIVLSSICNVLHSFNTHSIKMCFAILMTYVARIAIICFLYKNF